MRWVGSENYILAFTDPLFWQTLQNTFYIATIAGLLEHLVAIPVAYSLVSLKKSLRNWLTTLFFLPYVTSTIVASLIFFQMYEPNSGIFNKLLLAITSLPGLSAPLSWLKELLPIGWVQEEAWIRGSVSFFVFWKYTSLNIVIYTIGLLVIPKEYYEASRMDGANSLQQFWYISLPMLRPFVFFAVVLTIITHFQLFDEPYVLTRALESAYVNGMTTANFFYKVGWEWLQMGVASAIAWLLFIVIAVITGVYFYIFGRNDIGRIS